MKIKNKVIAITEKAIVLCSLLVVTLPVIAIEQFAQEVSASEVTTASEDDYTLGVYGNANEDDTIDMRDTTTGNIWEELLGLERKLSQK